jgi:hypothetical protein
MCCSLKHIKKLYFIAKEKNLSLPSEFESKSFNWLRKQYNGIGAEWMPQWIRNFVTKLFAPMEPAALIHDIDFLNKNKSYWNFTKANLRLLYNGIKIHHFCSGLALTVLCQMFGWTAWKEGKETMAYCYYLEGK